MVSISVYDILKAIVLRFSIPYILVVPTPLDTLTMIVFGGRCANPQNRIGFSAARYDE